MKTRWLDRRIGVAGPYLALCLSEAEFRKALQRLKSPSIPCWVNSGSHAATHFLENEDKRTCAIVCLAEGWESRAPIEVAALLVHEAAHVWQAHCRDIGESNPGDEQEAYAIQAIAQELMFEFSRRIQAP
jgi:hypothetical protein